MPRSKLVKLNSSEARYEVSANNVVIAFRRPWSQIGQYIVPLPLHQEFSYSELR